MDHRLDNLIREKALREADNNPTDSTVKRSMEHMIKTFLKPISAAGGPDNFVKSYLEAKGKSVTVGELKRKLEIMKRDIEQKMKREVRETWDLSDDMLLTEGFFTRVWSALKWVGKSVKWIWDTFISVLNSVVDSWFGEHPVGRIALGILLTAVASNYLETFVALSGATLPWYVPTVVILGFAMHFITETINTLALMSESESLYDFVTTTDPERARPMNFFKYIKSWIPGMRRDVRI